MVGAVGNSACFNRTFRIASDETNARVGTVSSDYTDGDDTSWGGVTVESVGNTIVVKVAGAIQQNIRWEGSAQYELMQV